VLIAGAGHQALAQNASRLTASPAETALGLTRDLPAEYVAACTEILRATRANPCPPLVPRDSQIAHGWGDAIDALAPSITAIDGRDIDAHGGHWTLLVGTEPRSHRAMADDLHIVEATAASRCRFVRLEGQKVEACALPPYPAGGYYGGHIAYAWRHRDVTYHITLHGHANERGQHRGERREIIVGGPFAQSS
jgi:hypothetical protein